MLVYVGKEHRGLTIKVESSSASSSQEERETLLKLASTPSKPDACVRRRRYLTHEKATDPLSFYFTFFFSVPSTQPPATLFIIISISRLTPNKNPIPIDSEFNDLASSPKSRSRADKRRKKARSSRCSLQELTPAVGHVTVVSLQRRRPARHTRRDVTTTRPVPVIHATDASSPLLSPLKLLLLLHLSQSQLALHCWPSIWDFLRLSLEWWKSSRGAVVQLLHIFLGDIVTLLCLRF